VRKEFVQNPTGLSQLKIGVLRYSFVSAWDASLATNSSQKPFTSCQPMTRNRTGAIPLRKVEHAQSMSRSRGTCLPRVSLDLLTPKLHVKESPLTERCVRVFPCCPALPALLPLLRECRGQSPSGVRRGPRFVFFLFFVFFCRPACLKATITVVTSHDEDMKGWDGRYPGRGSSSLCVQKPEAAATMLGSTNNAVLATGGTLTRLR
jgi:hypothetical protein